jgi:hypothetical protein
VNQHSLALLSTKRSVPRSGLPLKVKLNCIH